MQAILDATRDGVLRGVAEVAIVLSSRPEAHAIRRAQEASILTEVLRPGDFPTRDAYDEALVVQLRKASVDLVCLAGFMHIVGPRLLNAFERILNIHPALLPAFPGLHGQRKALEAGVKFSGCTVHFVNQQIDAGPIVAQAVVPVFDDDDVERLTQRILVEEHRIYPEAIRLVAQGQVLIDGRRVVRQEAKA